MGDLHAYRRGIGPFGLMLFSISAMIGSGWLFSPLYVGRIAGPAATLSWLIGGILVILIALTYAEVSTLLPLTGGSTRFPQLTHGTFISLFFGWITWFGLITAPPVETQALIQYAANFWPNLLSNNPKNLHGLSAIGYFAATLMMLLFAVINIYSVRLISLLNNVLSSWKILIAIFVGILLISISMQHHYHNFTNVAHGGFMPYGVKSIFVAVATGGVLFAFNGFKQAVELAGEAKNPNRSIMVGILGSLILVLLIYTLLQTGLISAIPPQSLIHGWQHVHYAGDSGPLAGLLTDSGYQWGAILLYTTALVATASAGLVFLTSSARTLYGLAANRQLPEFLTEVTERGIPVKAVFVSFIVGMTFFLPFHGWYAMVKFMSSIIALSYITGPVCCLSLRYQLPDKKRVFKLPFIRTWCFFAFYVCTMIVYWTGWQIVSKLGLCLFISFVLFIVYRLFSSRPRGVNMHWRASTWIWPYLVGLNLVSYLGNYSGGKHLIPSGWDAVLLALLSGLSLYLSVHFRAAESHVHDTLMRFEEEANTGIPTTVPDEQSEKSGLIS